MGNKRNISFADPFFLLQAHSVFITIITLILAKHSYTWCSDKSVITQGHHLHHIKVSCLGTNDYKKKQVMICFTIHSTHTFKRRFCFRYWCQLGGECFSNLCPLTVWRPVCVCVCQHTGWKCADTLKMFFLARRHTLIRSLPKKFCSEICPSTDLQMTVWFMEWKRVCMLKHYK